MLFRSLGLSEWGGFLLAWGMVAGLLLFLIALSRGLQLGLDWKPVDGLLSLVPIFPQTAQ